MSKFPDCARRKHFECTVLRYPRSMFQKQEMVLSNCDEKEGPIAITHADLAILGASGKVFSIGAKAHTTDVQIAILVCFVIH
jgi:hypothetical protein